jgi:hypothetical protein
MNKNKQVTKKGPESAQAVTIEDRVEQDRFAKYWIETSIMLGTLGKSEIATSVAPMLGYTSETARSKFYDDGYNRDQEFLTYWHDKFAEHFKRQSKAKVFIQMDKTIDKTRNLQHLVETAKYLEGNQQDGQPNIQVNIQNLVEQDKQKFNSND